MPFDKLRRMRDALSSATRLRDVNPNHPAIVAGSYIALLFFAVLVHRGAWNGGWKEDDARQLLSVMNIPFWHFLLDRDTWQTFADNAFTPILAGQYRGDMLLFGLNPRGFYLHHAVELAITSIFSYHLLCQRIPRHLSMLATIGLIVAMPTFSVMNFLSNRHYLTGLLLSIGSAHLYQRALHDDRTRNSIFSAGLFFLAMLAKELYAVVLIYFLLTSWRTPLFRRVLVLYVTSFVIFAAWRAYMLGSLLGGHHTDHLFIDRLAALSHVHRAIFGGDLVAAVFLVSVVILILRHRLFGIRQFVGLAAVLLAIYVPLLFATYAFQVGDYYFVLRLSFLPTWLCAAGLAYIAMLLHETGAKNTAGILMLAFIAITATASARRMDDFLTTLQEYDIQTKFIENAGSEVALFPSSLLNGFDGPLIQQVAFAAGHTPAGIILFRDDINPRFSSYWEYDVRCRCMVQLSHDKVLEKSAHLGRPDDIIISRNPISLLVTWQAQQGLASVVVEPDGDSWCLLSVPGMHSLESCQKSPLHFVRLIPKNQSSLFQAKIASRRKGGLLVSTPLMSVPIDGTLQWSRGFFLPGSFLSNGKSTICHIDSPGKKEVILSRTSPLELRGWILGPPNAGNDTIPLAILAGSTGKNFVANLHREPRPDVTNLDGTVIGGQVLDADLHRVESGNYRLLLGFEDTICNSSITMDIR
jgi:hypothetical protein